MRLTSDLWVAAFLRRVFARGDYGAIEKRGAYEAGAIFIVRRDRNGQFDLYSPAPQSDYESRYDDRRFVMELGETDETAVRKRLDSEMRFDQDVWIVEVEIGRDVLEETVLVMKPS